MRLVAVDTATPVESVAVVDGDALLSERLILRKRGHGPGVLDDIDGALSDAGWTLDDVEGLVCGLGPGSFTGLRIALATLKGLALARGLPLFGARTTQALCAGVATGGALAVLDARRGEVFAEGHGLDAPVCCAPEALLERLSATPSAWVGSGAARYAEVFRAGGARVPEDPALHAPRAACLARVVDLSRPAALATLEPIYIRPSDAEINYPNGFPAVSLFD